jgi:SAM-dependent methyltransferase
MLAPAQGGQAVADGPLAPTYFCTNGDCAYAASGFFSVMGQPVLIDFEASIFGREDMLPYAFAGNGGQKPPSFREKLQSAIEPVLFGTNRTAVEFVGRLVAETRRRAERPRILVVGGGTVGRGAEHLYDDPSIELVGTDVYPSAHTRVVADGHALPFADQSFDGVWIQAVLEHVLDPWKVVEEIRRVLKPDGLVFADTPFMQQVHMGAYDFSRFTVSGHRWLFRHFELISAGVTAGVGTAAQWTARYMARALTGSDKVGRLASYLFFWLRFFDRLTFRRPNADAASGVYFYGRKSEVAVMPKEMIAFYASQATPVENPRSA